LRALGFFIQPPDLQQSLNPVGKNLPCGPDYTLKGERDLTISILKAHEMMGREMAVMTSDILALLVQDVVNQFSNIAINDLRRPSLFFLWLLMLLMPLSHINRRDHITGLTYILFLVFALQFLLALHDRFLMKEYSIDWRMILLLTILATIASALRWYLPFLISKHDFIHEFEENLEKEGANGRA
jgi:hypothetical protein